MNNNRKYLADVDPETGDIILVFVDEKSKFNKITVLVQNYDIVGDELVYDLRLPPQFNNFADDEELAVEVETALIDIIQRTADVQAVEQATIAKTEIAFRTLLVERGFRPAEDKLALEYASDSNALVVLTPDNKLSAFIIGSKAPIDIEAVVAKIIMDNPTQKKIIV